MLTLFHHPLSAPCRKTRLMLGECDLAFTPQLEKAWERRPEFLALSPTGEVPLLTDEEGWAITDAAAICEYIHETKSYPNLIGDNAKDRAKVRSLSGFFDRVLYQEAILPLVSEKALKRLMGGGMPDTAALRQAYANLAEHMKHINWLAEQNGWLAAERLTLADLSAAAQLSVADYLGDVPWDGFSEARKWYARIKSRPCFRPLLADHIAGLPPPAHYANLDF